MGGFRPLLLRLVWRRGTGAGAGTWRGTRLGPPAVAAEFPLSSLRYGVCLLNYRAGGNSGAAESTSASPTNLGAPAEETPYPIRDDNWRFFATEVLTETDLYINLFRKQGQCAAIGMRGINRHGRAMVRAAGGLAGADRQLHLVQLAKLNDAR